jgi:hypothetical protein
LMQIYLFVSEPEPGVKAFTADHTGENLPTEYAPWRTLDGGRGLYLGSANDPFAIRIRISGYSLV